MDTQQRVPRISLGELRLEIKKEYTDVALNPTKGNHFHTGRRLAAILGYDEALLAGLPEANIASFAGTGNPFAVGSINPGETVVDVGSGAGFDSLIFFFSFSVRARCLRKLPCLREFSMFESSSSASIISLRLLDYPSCYDPVEIFWLCPNRLVSWTQWLLSLLGWLVSVTGGGRLSCSDRLPMEILRVSEAEEIVDSGGKR